MRMYMYHKKTMPVCYKIIIIMNIAYAYKTFKYIYSIYINMIRNTCACT